MRCITDKIANENIDAMFLYKNNTVLFARVCFLNIYIKKYTYVYILFLDA